MACNFLTCNRSQKILIQSEVLLTTFTIIFEMKLI